MKINEFIEYMKKNTNRTMKEDQFMSIVKKALDVKKYIPIGEKKNLIDKIINQCIYYTDGVYKIDGIEKYVYFTMYVIESYTNLELSENIESDFDLLSESDLLPIVIGAIGKEYDDVNILLQLKCDDILVDNSVEAQCGKLCTYIIDSLDNLQDGLSKFTEGLQLDKLLDGTGKENLTQLLNTLKG